MWRAKLKDCVRVTNWGLKTGLEYHVLVCASQPPYNESNFDHIVVLAPSRNIARNLLITEIMVSDYVNGIFTTANGEKNAKGITDLSYSFEVF